MRKEFLVYGAPKIGEAEINEVVDTLKSGWVGTGPKVAQFEQDFKAYKGVEYAVALNSCTAALHLSLVAAGVGPGDEVITTAMTFVASVNAILHAGATPVLADIDPHTLNIDPAAIRQKINENTKAILVVHFGGRPCEMDEIMEIVHAHELILIEDCAHAIETTYKGIPAGTFGTYGCLSFYVTKNIITAEGGMVISNNEEKAARIKVLGLHGMSKDAWKRFGDEGYKHYFVEELGFKYNMTDIQASLGIHQLKRVDEFWNRRETIWNRYQAAFSDLPIGLPAQPAPETRHAYHLYTILIDSKVCGISRDQFLVALTQLNIGTGVHYLSIPEHPYYQHNFGWNPDQYPHARQVGRQTLSLPLSPALTDEDVQDVIEAVRLVCGKSVIATR